MSSFILFNLGTISLFIYSIIWAKFNVFQLYRQCFYFHWSWIFFFFWFTKRIKTDLFFSISCSSNKEYCKTILRNAYPVKYKFWRGIFKFIYIYIYIYIYIHIYVWKCVCMWERERKIERKWDRRGEVALKHQFKANWVHSE